MSATPVILLGRTEQIGTGVIAALKPEYDVIHFILNTESAIAELSYVLQGQEPPAKSSGLGSGKYNTLPKAIIFGGGYDDAAIDEILKAIGGTNVALLKVDQSIPMPPVGPEYGKKIIERCKGKLGELAGQGVFDESQGGVFNY